MKTSLHILFAALAAIATTAACVQEITPPSFEKDKVNPAAEGSRVIAVSFAPQTKTALDKDGFQPVFVDGDKILVANGQDEPDTCVVSVKDGKATISTNLTGPLNAVYPAKAARMDEQNPKAIGGVLVSTEQDGTFASANICMAKNISEDAKEVTFMNKTALFRIIPVAGAQYVEVSAEGYEIANDYTDESAYKSCDIIHVAPITADTVYVSTRVSIDLTIGSLTFSDGTNEKTVTGDKASTAIAAGTLYTVTNENWKSLEADIPEGALTGEFSVSTTKKVHFSQGNLYWNGDSFEFEANQYDFQSSWNADHVSHFHWSKTASVAYAPSYSESGTSGSDVFFTNDQTDEEKANSEFTVNGVIGKYRTLSKDEWTYLFNTTGRMVNGKSCYSNAMNGVSIGGTTYKGIFLYPDNYNGYVVSSSMTWDDINAAGIVFLPAAGDRQNSNVVDVGDVGLYWSATAGGNSAYRVLSTITSVGGVLGVDRYVGYGVRLVTDVSAAPTPAEPTSEYVEIAADYDNDPNTANTTLKWYRQNLAITDSGNKSWKGGNESAVKVPGTDEDVIVGDYFQWGAYENYALPVNDLGSGETDKGLLIYESFTNKYCVNGGSEDKFEFKSPEAGKTYQFDAPSPEDDDNSVGISPYFDGSKGEDGEYTKYTGTDNAVLDSSNDVAHIILGDNWRMPTSAEFDAMKEATYWVWDSGDMGYYVYAPASGDEGGLNGKKSDETAVTGTYKKEDALLFFPAAGYGNNTSLSKAGSISNHWSSSLDMEGNKHANCLYFKDTKVEPEAYPRSRATSVRPVSDL